VEIIAREMARKYIKRNGDRSLFLSPFVSSLYQHEIIDEGAQSMGCIIISNITGAYKKYLNVNMYARSVSV